MREFDALHAYPRAGVKREARRTVLNQLAAMDRGQGFFDGDRVNGYGGLINDGRWDAVAKSLATEYQLGPQSRVIQVEAELGYLVQAFHQLNIRAWGTETSPYAREHAVVPDLIAESPVELYHDHFDLVLAIGVVYTLNLREAVECLRRLQNVARRAFITLAAYETEEDFWLMRRWSLLGCLLYKPGEWREIMEYAGYDGDYVFVTARTLGLVA